MKLTSGLMIAAVLFGGAATVAASESLARTIRVSGIGAVSVAPDTIVIAAGADTFAPQAASALDTNNRMVESIKASAMRAGVKANDMRTTQFNISPQMTRSKTRGNTPTLTGYRVSHVLEIRSADIVGGGALLDKIVGAGANVVRDVRFTIADNTGALQQARKLAVADAQSKANVLAQAASVRLGRILSIEDGVGRPGGPVPHVRLRAAASVPITAGEQKLTVTVTLTYDIAD